MSLHDIHSCSKICSENVELRQKLAYMTRKKEEAQRLLDDHIRSRGTEQQRCSRPAMKVVAIQTDTRLWSFHNHSQDMYSKKTAKADVNQINKVLEMHSNVLKRYDKEVKQNMSYVDTISDLNMKLAETERMLREEKEKIMQLERKLSNMEEKLAKRAEAEDPVLRDLVQERSRLVRENRKLRQELRSLDQNFFDEIEDLKYALLQSTKLNAEYETLLKKLSQQFGVPYVVTGSIRGQLKDGQHGSTADHHVT